jgi:RHS repeat-associated protein
VIAHEETDVEMPLEQLALNKTNDPNPVRYDGESPIFEPEGIKVASIGSLAGILSQTVVANTNPPKVYYYLNDHLGTPQLMTDENNVVVWEAKYRPFGEAVVHPYSTVDNNIRFPGQYYDAETGLHYNYHRYYDPRTGRYLRADPSHSVQSRCTMIPYFSPDDLTTEPYELLLFAYTANNPINSIDPNGLNTDPCQKYEEPWEKCLNAPSLPSNSSECNKYKNERYLGVNLKCFCKCAGNSPWSKRVRGCLRCMEVYGVSRINSHIECWGAADKAGLNRPNAKLTYCFFVCLYKNDYSLN